MEVDPFPNTHTQEGRRDMRTQLLASNDVFVTQIPKVELHVHIEGTLTPALRWKLAKRNGIPVRLASPDRHPAELQSEQEVEKAYGDVISSAQLSQYAARAREDPSLVVPATFFEAYYSGCDVLRTRQDFFDLAYDHFQRAAGMNVRYCEVFFDPQSHTSRGVPWDDFMGGLREAQQEAATELNVQSQWIMCFLRDSPIGSAKEHYRQALAYRDMIIGFGLDSNETNHPPHLFDEVFAQARADGFHITAHCDVGQRDTHANIRHVAGALGGTGADRVDHGLNAADQQELTSLVAARGIGLTICPWAYLRRWTYRETAERLRVLLDQGVRFSISSDSPAYMDDSWVLHNLLLAKQMGGLSDRGVLELMKVSVGMSWASNEVKGRLLHELDAFALTQTLG
ncbi:uncharacterized protein B0I36DRAFT_297907 [Microdochium trichocladiopsis]|uniref:Adenosine deaminase domain-containing protein n=1 Tax=Microdochium trichocladiopsis TaxID=1682393 RepID=A0A9P8XUF0_9PEZI|nr:uncharacterized protein B0I36DRAFT_297907 [Microdochium trichocladiopsis]KAH7018322.1 hypothetical protein B0I36DRAFT_297907 [Microdochium trichocladiopsis]